MDKELTEQHMKSPQPGDRFHEMYSVWLIVLAVDVDGSIYSMIVSGSERRIQRHASADEFAQAHAYGGIPGYPWRYSDGTGMMPWENQRSALAAALNVEVPQ